MSVILKELSTLLYETNIRLSNSGLIYNYIISKLFKLVDNGKPAYQGVLVGEIWVRTHIWISHALILFVAEAPRLLVQHHLASVNMPSVGHERFV